MKRLRDLLWALIGLACLAARPSLGEVPLKPVKVAGGQIIGSRLGGLNVFLGIPFAAPPVGDLRWRAPQPVVSWTGVRTTRAFSPACEQTAAWISNPKSEDCLYLNVWAPVHTRHRLVIVWIHGGAMESGTAAVPVQDGANLANRGAVVVTLNYRLGIFGFYASPELSAESPEHVSGNQGLLDQIAALKWVKANISGFGGDPNRVTIMGSSSGGESVALLVASPLAKGLFQRAIAESGNDAMPISPEDDHRFDHKTAAEAKGLAFAGAVGARRLADLRRLSVRDLQKVDWLPRVYVDGYLLPSDLATLYQNRRQNDVPLLVGWTAEEGKDLVGFYLDASQSMAARHIEQMTRLLGYPPSDRMLSIYPATNDAEASASIDRLMNDWWGWRMVRWAGLQARYGRSRSYVYYFAHRPAPPSTPCNWGCGAGHGVEVQYMLDNLGADPRSWTSEDRQLATRLADTVIQFARTGSPQKKQLPAWPAFDGTNASVMLIGNEAELQSHPLPDFPVFSQDMDEASQVIPLSEVVSVQK